MKSYYDTGILLKLYTAEADSVRVQQFVQKRNERLCVTDIHVAECISALRLKVFRQECRADQSSAAISLIKEDLKSGVLVLVDVNWSQVWEGCRLLADQFASLTGARTLDTLHVSVAQVLEAEEFITSDQRQIHLARQVGMTVFDPTTTA